MEQDIVLQVENLKTQFKVGRKLVRAVNGVSFQLRKGTTLGIVGESGCGKSVTAHSIMQLLPKNGFIAEGSVRYTGPDGQERELSAYKRSSKQMRAVRGKDIAMIFQDPMSSLDPVYSIGSQIAENLRQHEKLSQKEARARIIKMLSDLDIPIPEKRYDEYPYQFSGGMKQRVMIAMAMICNPNILIADEPTTALDVTIQAQILALMKRLQEEYGTSIILITHNMGIVAESCDDVAVMYMGHIVEYGSIDQIFSTPMHPYTQGLLKAVPVLGIGKDNKLGSIRGSTPDASEVFAGCEFEPRCDHCCEKCRTTPPPDRELPDGHRVRCWLYAGGEEDAGT